MNPTLATAALLLIAGLSPAAAATAAVCVSNASEQRHFFVAEAAGGQRNTGWLAPTETLCAVAAGPTGGVVSVFESETHMEGCSRLVPGNQTESLLRYVDFDRCFWASNTN